MAWFNTNALGRHSKPPAFQGKEGTGLASDQQLTASQKHGVIYQAQFMAIEGQSVVQVVHGTDILKHVEPNDFVISMRSFQGGIEWCGLRGSISSAYVMLIASKSIVPKYFRYLFKSKPYIQALQSTTNLVRDGQALRYSNFVQVPLPVIPHSEQVAVFAFLDRETAKIDELIQEQEHLIDKLKEKIAAMAFAHVRSAETRELRLGQAVELISRPVVQNDDEIYVPLGVYNRGRGLFHKEPRKREDMGDSDFFWVESGDLIISGQFAWEGSIALAGNADTGSVVSHRYYTLRGLRDVVSTEYLFAILSTRHGGFLLNENSRGAAGRNKPLNIKSLLKEKVPVPAMRIQNDIAIAVHDKLRLVAEINRQNELLQERRSALISAAVTGKIDVRGLVPATAEAA